MKPAASRSRRTRPKYETLEKDKHCGGARVRSASSPVDPKTAGSTASSAASRYGQLAEKKSSPLASGAGSVRRLVVAENGSSKSEGGHRSVSKVTSLSIKERMSKFDSKKDTALSTESRSSLVRKVSAPKSSQIQQAMHRFEERRDSTPLSNPGDIIGDKLCGDVDSARSSISGPSSTAARAKDDDTSTSTGNSTACESSDVAVASQGDSTPEVKTNLSRSKDDEIPRKDGSRGSARTQSSPTTKRGSSGNASTVSTRRDSTEASASSRLRRDSTEASASSRLRRDSTEASASSRLRRDSTEASASSRLRRDSTEASASSRLRRKSSDAGSDGKKATSSSSDVSRKDSVGAASPSSRRPRKTSSAGSPATSSPPASKRYTPGTSSSLAKKDSITSAPASSPSSVRKRSSDAAASPLSGARRKPSTDSTSSTESALKRKQSTTPSASSSTSSRRGSKTQSDVASSASGPVRRRKSSVSESASSTRSTANADVPRKTRDGSQSPSSSRSGRSSPAQRRRSSAASSDMSFDDLKVQPRLVSEHQSHRIMVAPGGRRKATKNPVKALQERSDVLDELEPAPAESVGKQVFSKSAQLAGMNISMAAGALAGLAAKENVGAVKLTSVTDVNAIVWPKKLLIHIKGRRSLQTRIVEPNVSSMNSGDSFILVNGDNRSLFQFIGKGANVVERAKSADLVQDIFHGKDCGCKAPKVTIVEEGKISSQTSEGQFWKALTGKDGKPADFPAEVGEDLIVEKDLIKKIVAYEIVDDKVVLRDDLSGKSLKFASLDPAKVMIFDFENEVASWTGRRAPQSIRKNTASLTKDVFDRGYISKEGAKSGKSRPSWALLMSCKDGSETILFRSKFSDWPDPGKVIKTRAPASKTTAAKMNGTSKSAASSTAGCDGVAMRRNSEPYPGLVVLQRNLGRGHGEAPSDDPCLPGVVVKTVSVKKWQVRDNKCHEVKEAAYSDFFEEDAYIVRWVYSLYAERSNIKTGIQSKQVGSDQTVYFFWQGANCCINEKGTAALIVVELSGSEGDPQIRVAQGSEPPAFLQMFNGAMTIHCGSSKGDTDTASDVRLYAVHGLVEAECHLDELPGPIDHTSLRSRHSAVLVDSKRSQVYVWHGKSSSKTVKARAYEAATKLASRQTSDNTYAICTDDKDIIELDQGDSCARLERLVDGFSTSAKFWDNGLVLGGCSAPRVFTFGSSSGSFKYSAQLRQWRKDDLPIAYPAPQSVFYHDNQPAVGFFEAGNELFIWCGWMREQGEDDRTIGSVKSKWMDTKKRAFQTAKSYLADMKKDGLSGCHATVITAGYEPDSFRSLFLHWETDEEAVQAVEKVRPCSQLEPIDLEEELETMAGVTHPLALLRTKPLPDNLDVDPKTLEIYLSDADFQVAFSQTREEFEKIPAWKKVQLRKSAGLF
ncbi:supervillin-like isoform X2 [Sycon ciliatum]|uniref:supervillin-like isoform X2 n=1 Tax=Sycon ciliatum TaxID=27933 RepID=UPI0031F70E48